MKIVVATTGRFHLLDLARELSARGHRVTLFSCVPPRRAAMYGLPRKCYRYHLLLIAPLYVLQRVTPAPLRATVNQWMCRAADWLVCRALEPCDVFVGLSGAYVDAARVARKKYGAKVLIERGSRHILDQRRILQALRGSSSRVEQVTTETVNREMAGYEVADLIAVPSRQVEESFLQEGVPASRLFRNAYGVDLHMFSPTVAPSIAVPTIIFAGAWSMRKGVDVLVRAWRLLGNVRLMHVGAVVDAPLPEDDGFEHVDPVPQWMLREYYAKAHLFVMASREEGLALVQAQALACGLPVVCTERTGGADLRAAVLDPQMIQVVPSEDSAALVAAIGRLLPIAVGMTGMRDLLGEKGRETLSWTAYGRRYSERLERLVAEA